MAMKLLVWAAAVCCLAGFPVLSAETQDGRVVVSLEDCQRLVRHVPSADVEYKPGVDVHGNPVVPADLPGSQPLKVPDSYEFDITVNVFERLGRDPPKGLGGTELKVGTVSVDKRGNVSFNGQRLSWDDKAAIAEACRELMKSKNR